MPGTQRRRGYHEGTGYKRADGRWEWKISLPDGTRKSFYGKTQREAREKANQAAQDAERGIDLSVRSVTMKTFLSHWIEETARERVRPSTLAAYSGHVQQHIVPALGSEKLRSLTPQHVNKLMSDMVGSGLSPATANRVRSTLRNALGSAVKWGYVSQNVAALADPRRETRTPIKPLELDQIRSFLEFVKDDRHGPLIHVAVATGLRQGELLALRWGSDVDLDRGAIHVHHTLTKDYGAGRFNAPKTDESRRTVKLTSTAITALRRQQQLIEEHRMLATDRWQDHDLVFPSTVGTPLDNSHVTHRLQALLERGGLPKQRFHDLRHATASLLLAEGLDLFTVKEILGHSQISLTANTYGHLMKKLSEDAAGRLERALAADDTIVIDDNPDDRPDSTGLH